MQLAPPISLLAVLPELLMLTAVCAVLLIGQIRRPGVAAALPWLSLLGVVATLLLVRGPTLFGYDTPAVMAGSGLDIGPLAEFVRVSTLIVGVLILLVSWSMGFGDEKGEFFALLLASLLGLMLVGSAADLVVLFLALELVSIPTYVLVTLSQGSPRALEAGTKYFYLGAMSAAIVAYGFSFLYGVAGTAQLTPQAVENVAAALSAPGSFAHGLAVVGVVLSVGGLLFKIAAFPLHFYVADVYQGAASPVAGMLGFVPKLAGMVAIIKIINLTNWQTLEGGAFWMLWIVAALSMTIGNALALRQTSVKRMLAYSGIAHSGYMLVGVLAGPHGGDSIVGDGPAAVLFYVVVYGIANLGAFALLGVLRVGGQACESVRDLAGLLRRNPGAALLMALAMFTLMGLPPTAGFWGKLTLFGGALAASDAASAANQPWIIALVVIALLNSAVAAAYYLRVIASVLLYENDDPADTVGSEAQHVGAILCGLLSLIFAFAPGVLLQRADIPRIAQQPVPRVQHVASADGAGALPAP